MPGQNQRRTVTKKELQERLELLTEALQRERADVENSRRRAATDTERITISAKAEAVASLLPLLDNLERAFESVPEELADNNWVKGVLYIRQQLKQYLQELNLQPVMTVGKEFNPLTMEAVEVITDASKPPGTVVAEVIKGYIYGDQVLRPAQVKVVKELL